MRLILRSLALLSWLLVGLLSVACVPLIQWALRGHFRPERFTYRWHRGLLRIVGVRARVHGVVPQGVYFVVANHVSWIDIPLIAAFVPVRFLAKVEVRRMPVAGWLASAVGTLYIDRGRGALGPLSARMTDSLRLGRSIAVFPEGTTHDGVVVADFHSRLFSVAQEAGVAVLPLALRYGPGDSGQAVAPFVGRIGTMAHLLRLMRNRKVDAELWILPPIPAARFDRKQLALEARARIVAALQPAATQQAA
jgi:1-acyl-sn-glycerol-3-phosphate acyltransferase